MSGDFMEHLYSETTREKMRRDWYELGARLALSDAAVDRNLDDEWVQTVLAKTMASFDANVARRAELAKARGGK